LGRASLTVQSYHDLAVRLEPVILELEREKNNLLIIAHESVLRVLYGYLMARNATDIPRLQFPRDEIIEVGSSPWSCTVLTLQIVPESYNNVANHIRIPGIAEQAGLAPGSPTDIQLSVPMINLTVADPMSPTVPGGGVRSPPQVAAVALPPAALDDAGKASNE
jgi:hypothetical protein